MRRARDPYALPFLLVDAAGDVVAEISEPNTSMVGMERAMSRALGVRPSRIWSHVWSTPDGAWQGAVRLDTCDGEPAYTLRRMAARPYPEPRRDERPMDYYARAVAS